MAVRGITRRWIINSLTIIILVLVALVVVFQGCPIFEIEVSGKGQFVAYMVWSCHEMQ